jgi:pimeloyl-ACP methyl ester carboxylesterase
MTPARPLWLHGFASSPKSSKARFARARFAERGQWLAIPDLNEPSFRELTVSRMLAQVDAFADESPLPLVLCGSSLGGYTAALWAASRPSRVAALVLLAPAFDLAARWQSGMKPEELARWQREGAYPVEHHAHGRTELLGARFLEDARALPPFPLPDAPTLVLQGTRDEVVAPELAREFARRMRDAGKTVRLVELDDGHELTGDLPALWREMAQHLDALWPPAPCSCVTTLSCSRSSVPAH